jgi:hypothetical protein
MPDQLVEGVEMAPAQWQRGDQNAARAQDAAQFGNRLAVVLDVLDDVHRADQIGSAGRQRQAGDRCLDGDAAIGPQAGHGDRRQINLKNAVA